MSRGKRFDWLFRPHTADEDLPLSAEASFAEALADLPAVERSALALSEIGGLETEEIARYLGTEPAVVTSVLARARHAVRASLAARGRGLVALLPLQSWWQAGGAAPAVRAAGTVAAAVVGTGVVIGGASADPVRDAQPTIRDAPRVLLAAAPRPSAPEAPQRSVAGAPERPVAETVAVAAALAPPPAQARPRRTPSTSPQSPPAPTAPTRPAARLPEQPSTRQADRPAPVPLVAVPAAAVGDADVALPVLDLPDVTELVGEGIVGNVLPAEPESPVVGVPVIAP